MSINTEMRTVNANAARADDTVNQTGTGGSASAIGTRNANSEEASESGISRDGVDISSKAENIRSGRVASLDDCEEAEEAAGVGSAGGYAEYTREEAAASLLTMGKGGDPNAGAKSIDKSLNRQYGASPDYSYGNENKKGKEWVNSAVSRAEAWLNTWNTEENRSRFTGAGAFSRAGETMMYAVKEALEQGLELPDVLLHVDDVVYQDGNRGFAQLKGLDMDRVVAEGKAAYKASSGKNMSDAATRAGYASAFVNGAVSAHRDQCLIYSTAGEGGPTKSAAFVEPIYQQMCEAEDYSKFGFNLPEGVSVADVYQDNSCATFVDEDGNFTNENITSDNVYVIVYSDGTQSVHEIVGTKFNHDSINKDNGDDTAGMMVDYLTSKGREYYSSAD